MDQLSFSCSCPPTKGLLTSTGEGSSRSRTGRVALWNSLPLTLVPMMELQTFLTAWINHGSNYFKLEGEGSIWDIWGSIRSFQTVFKCLVLTRVRLLFGQRISSLFHARLTPTTTLKSIIKRINNSKFSATASVISMMGIPSISHTIHVSWIIANNSLQESIRLLIPLLTAMPFSYLLQCYYLIFWYIQWRCCTALWSLDSGIRGGRHGYTKVSDQRNRGMIKHT